MKIFEEKGLNRKISVIIKKEDKNYGFKKIIWL